MENNVELTRSQKWRYVITRLRNGIQAPVQIVMPTISEVQSLRKSYPGRVLRLPNAEMNFRRLLKEGCNVVMTVDMFLRQRMTPQLCRMLDEKGYTILLDDGVDEWMQMAVSEFDVRIMLAERLIVISPDGHVRWRDGEYTGLFSDIQETLREHEAVLEHGVIRIAQLSRALRDKRKPLSLEQAVQMEE